MAGTTGRSKNFMRVATATAIGLVAGCPGIALSQERSPQAPAPSVAPDAGPIEDIVVTARRSSENAQRVPITITTVTAAKLRDLNVRDVVDIQKVTPGLFISTNQNSGKARITIRGQIEADDRLTGDRSVGVSIDSVPFEHSYALTSVLVDLNRVEVLKGPQGTLFGKNTTGGELNITTNQPEYKWGGYADLLYGNYNKMQGLAVVNAPIVEDKLAIRLVGQVISREGYYREFDGHQSNDDNQTYVRLRVRADPTENLHILLSADHVDQANKDVHLALTNETLLAPGNVAVLQSIAAQLGLNPRSVADQQAAYRAFRVYYDAQQVDPRRGFGNPYNPHDELKNTGLSANIALDVGPVTARSITSYRNLTRSASLELDGTPFDIIQQSQAAHLKGFTQELQLSAIDNVGFDWQAGLFYSRETGEDLSATDSFDYVNPNRSGVTDSGIVNSSKAAYAQAVYAITPRLRVTGGIRYTHDYRQIDSHNRIDLSMAIPPLPPGGTSRCGLLSPALGGPVYPNCTYKASTSSNKVTWLASADWRPINDVMLYASVSTGYRSGAFTAPGTNVITSQAALQAAFTPYQPETVTNYEVGFKSDLLGHHLRINGAGFYENYRDIQVRVNDFVNGVLLTLVRNAAKATIYGGELEVTAAPTSRLTFTGGAGYVHAGYDSYITRDSAGNVLDLTALPFAVPKWTFNLGGNYELPLADGALRLTANYAYTSRVIYQPTAADRASVTQPAFGLLDARLNWHIASQNLDVALFGKNLTNKLYFSSISVTGPFNIGSVGEPRTYGIQVRKTF